jgi:hypothetical protein
MYCTNIEGWETSVILIMKNEENNNFGIHFCLSVCSGFFCNLIFVTTFIAQFYVYMPRRIWIFRWIRIFLKKIQQECKENVNNTTYFEAL